MADITMCRGTGCPKKKRCYRFTALVNPYWQAYFGSVPYNPETKSCEHFWRMYKKTKYEKSK
jgi:hypothetical protein